MDGCMKPDDLYSALERLLVLEKELQVNGKLNRDYNNPLVVEYVRLQNSLPDVLHIDEIRKYHDHMKQQAAEQLSVEKEELAKALDSLKNDNQDLKNESQHQNERVKETIDAVKATLETQYKKAYQAMLDVLRQKCSPGAYSALADEIEDIFFAVTRKEASTTASESHTSPAS